MKRIDGMHPGNLEIAEDVHVSRAAMIGGDLLVRGPVRVIVGGMVGCTPIADGSDV